MRNRSPRLSSRTEPYERPSPQPLGSDGDWWNLFAGPQSPQRQRRIRVHVLIVVGVVAVACIGILLPTWPLGSQPDGESTNSTTTQPPRPAGTADPVAQQRLLSALPSGYPPDTCTSTAVSDALARVTCGSSTDPTGPASATFTLFPNQQALSTAFDAIVARLQVVTCPGNIQSPGPWRSIVAPQQENGTLVCGFAGSWPVVSWTKSADQVASYVQSDRAGTTIDDLYRWWSHQS